MADNKNVKSKIWVYAVVLFMSAFIVLMLTAVSQIKFNKNIMDYESIIYNKENEKNNFVSNLKSAEENIKLLKNEISALNTEIKKTKKQIEDTNKIDEEKLQQETLKRKEYDKLLLANINYQKKDYISCAIALFKNIDVTKLDSIALEQYNYLKENSFEKAAFALYKQGYDEYSKNNYEKAISSFTNSFQLSKDQYYSDDCLFFSAISEFKLGRYQKAIDNCNLLFKTYENSSLKKEVNKIIDNATKMLAVKD